MCVAMWTKKLETLVLILNRNADSEILPFLFSKLQDN